MKIVTQHSGPIYSALNGKVEYCEYPENLSAAATNAAANGSNTTGLPTDPQLAGVFVGQVPFTLPPAYLAWAINLLVGQEIVVEALMARNQSCGRVVIPREYIQHVLSLSESALFDSSGLWVARTPEQVKELELFSASLGTGEFGSHLLRHPLPKKAIVIRPQQPRQSKPSFPVPMGSTTTATNNTNSNTTTFTNTETSRDHTTTVIHHFHSVPQMNPLSMTSMQTPQMDTGTQQQQAMQLALSLPPHQLYAMLQQQRMTQAVQAPMTTAPLYSAFPMPTTQPLHPMMGQSPMTSPDTRLQQLQLQYQLLQLVHQQQLQLLNQGHLGP